LVVIAIIAVPIPIILGFQKLRASPPDARRQEDLFLREARLHALDNVLTLTRQADDPSLPRMVAVALRDPAFTRAVLRRVDRDRDGRIKPAELASFGATTDVPVVAMVLGEYFGHFPLRPSDAKVAPRVEDVERNIGSIFAYENVGALTGRYVLDRACARALIASLEGASRADAAGRTDLRDRALASYAALVRSQAGKSLAIEHAANLLIAVEYLKLGLGSAE
jgi:hypothetical protein